MMGEDLIPYCTIPAVMESVANGDCSFGVVPIENSIEGPVGITLDSLAHKFDLKIFKEIILPINQNFIVNPGCKMEDIEDVYSHAQALAQCQDFVRKNNIQPHYAISTARAAKDIIGDKLTGDDKTSIIFSIYEDKPGGLYNILGIFEKNNINLTKIESRPSKKGLGKYLFFVDFNGHKDEELIQNILEEVQEQTYYFKVLGSYPQYVR